MSITFDLTGSNPDSLSMIFANSGLKLTISSGLFDPDNNNQIYENTPILNQTVDGIGMLNPSGDAEVAIDGDGKHEVAIFAFSQVVKITSITLMPMPTRFNETAEGVAFRLFADDLVAASSSTLIDASHTNTIALYGDLVGIGAYTRLDGFRIASITVEFPFSDTLADQASMTRNVPVLDLSVLANDTDAKSILSVNATGALGSVSIAANGQSLIYTNTGGFSGLNGGQSAVETFTYTILGWDGVTHTETVSLTIKGVGGQNFITGTSSANTLTGTALHDTIDGLAGNDKLYGGAGDDLLYGRSGKDILDGQAGGDEMLGGADNDTYYVDDTNDVIVELVNEGTDSVNSSATFTLSANVEKLILTGSGNINGTGNTLSNTITGNGGNNLLFGGAGDDIINGGLGADTMHGGAGSDSFTVDDLGDVVIERYSEGSDKVTASVTFALGGQVENLTLTGNLAIDGTGNAVKNTLTGNDGANILLGFGNIDKLLGGLGADTLNGGTGKDTLTGGGDADTFQFGDFGSNNWDNVTDFALGQDVIGLIGSAFGLAAGALTAQTFALGTVATNKFQHILYDQATGNIWFDADGNGAGAKQQIGSLTDGLALGLADFFVF